ncbi:MAG: thiamine pyrophosphate-dependent dehydrogenase E1 component subunit alpha [Kiloniellales bacterium]|nr:thiamine pyrophosphate-dependent dehydrogenase E1 component subunit alpha [Kiloniellales bacterium]
METKQGSCEGLAIRLYQMLRYIRRVEEEIARVYPSDDIKSPVHLSIGQEFVTVAVSDVLRADDVCGGSYRGHAVYLARGGSLKRMIAELYGKSGGCAGGKGGSMHLIAADNNVLGASAVVATHIPHTAGVALALKRLGGDRIAVCFFGDGATEEGCFYETVNFASLHGLPVLFVCENNFYAIHEPLSKRWARNALVERMQSFGVKAQRVADGEIFSVREAAAKAVEHVRSGNGPAFLEVHAYRWKEHVGPNEDFAAGYRSRDEADSWIANDQLTWLAGMVPQSQREAIDVAIEEQIREAFDFAENSPFPEPQELMTHVFAE